MVQVKQRFRHRSPPPRRIPTLPPPIQFQPPKLYDDRPITQKTGSDVNTIISNDKQSNLSNDAAKANNLLEASFVSVYSSTTEFEPYDKPAFLSNSTFLLPANNITSDSTSLLTMDDNLDRLLHKKHLPVFARFPFHVSSIPKFMETNFEDNIHRLRLRLIDSEREHQRISTEDYISRTQKSISISSPTSVDYEIPNLRSPPLLIHQQVIPRLMSRQTSVSILSVATPSSARRISRDRIGIDSDLPHHADIERELEILRIEDSLNKPQQLNQPTALSNFSHDTRMQLQHLNEKNLYPSTNVDDMIDSMARRHLAYRRLDAAIDRQRRPNRYQGSLIESMNSGRTSFRNSQRNDDLISLNRSIRNPIDNDLNRINSTYFNERLRSRIDYYNRIQPDPDSLGIDDSIYGNSYMKLPPISSGFDSHRFGHIQTPLTPVLYDIKSNDHVHQHHTESIPLKLSNHTEHSINLPSDIYLTSRADPLNITQYQSQIPLRRSRSISKENGYHTPQKPLPQTPKNRPVSISKHNSMNNSQHTPHIPKIAPVVTLPKDRRSYAEVEKPLLNHQQNHHENNSKRVFDHNSLRPDSKFQEKKKPKSYRKLWRKISIGTLFVTTIKQAMIKRHSDPKYHHRNRSPSALIHKIRLQEIIVALHRVYLEPEGAIHSTLINAINQPISLKHALDKSSKHYSEVIQLIGFTIQTVISKITEFMPKEGVLGTERGSVILALIQDGNPFPEGYFWQCERELLDFDNLKVININKDRARLLIIGIFLFRALITTLLLKPIKYRFILGHLTPNQSVALKILASVLLYIGRRAARSKSQLLALPHEWKLSLYTDADIDTIIQNSDINSIINKCEQSLRVWCEEYIRRIDASLGKELRT